ncbi:MAG: DUF4249 family protein [Tenuifilaceae bacterium]
MLRTRIIFILIVCISVFSSCIEEYSPSIKETSKNKYVVFGKVTDQEGYQYVSVSVSSPLNKPLLNPLSGCWVDIFDDAGNQFHLLEFEKGKYRVWINQEYLKAGASFQLSIHTPNAETIISEYDVMPEKLVSEDTVYYSYASRPTNDPNFTENGLQFLVDFNAKNSNNRFFKWELEETWEYHSYFPISNIWDGKKIINVIPADYSLMVCWKTANVNQIFTLSTKTLTSNSYSGFKIHFVGNLTQKLFHGYSLLVRQQAINEKAYYYWDQIRINNNQNGGLYSQQPYSIDGNLILLDEPDNEVFGIFHTASESKKRYFFHNIENLDFDFSGECVAETFIFKNAAEIPCYITFNLDLQEWQWAPKSCFDCRLSGGTIIKPDFWPIK